MLKRKRKPDDVLIQSDRSKIAKLEQDVKVANKKLKDISNLLQNIVHSIKSYKEGKTHHSKPCQNKAWEESSLQYQRKRQRQIANDVQTALLFTQDENFKPTNIELINEEIGKIMCINQDGQVKEKNILSLDSSRNAVDQTLHVKQKFNNSNKAYHEISMINSRLPRLRSLQNVAKLLMLCQPTPGKLIVVQQSLNERLQWTIKSLVKKNPSFCSN